MVAATWTQNIAGIAITVTNSGATCRDTVPGHVAGAMTISCPTSGLQAWGSSTATSFSVSLGMPHFEMQAFTTGGALGIGTRANLSGAPQIAGDAVSATVKGAVHGSVVIGGARHGALSSWSQPYGATLLQIPLDIGKAGQLIGSFWLSSSYHYITVDFYAWRPDTLSSRV